MAGESPDDLSPAFFETMVESVGVGVGIYGEDGRYIYVNDAYAELFGVSPPELVGQPLWDIVPELEGDRFDDYVDSFEEGETREAETVHTFAGREVPVQIITTRWTIDGTAYHFGTMQDITERRAREREIERQNERLENFASIVSHDLRNPLTVAQGYIDLLQEDVDRDELRLVDNSLARMETLIAELLDLARNDDGVGDTERVSLRTVATNAWESVPTADADLSVAGGDVTLVADESRLQQLFENLFRNAVEHGSTSPRSEAHEDAVEHGSTSPRSEAPADTTEHGGSGLHITVGATPEGFYVEDDGTGIPAETRERVFETGYTTSEEGSGFGLNIVKQIVTSHGWEIRAAEATTGGARFEVAGVDSIE